MGRDHSGVMFYILKSEAQQIEELKASMEKDHGRAFTHEEAVQVYQLVKLLAEISVDSTFKEVDCQKKLEESPKGFHLEESGTCKVCGQPAVKENSWYDKNGVKCIPCQKALDKKLIPASIIGKRDNWYSKNELEIYFNIGKKDLNKYVKAGFLKKRIIPLDEKQIHLELFLIRDNKDVLPSKKLLPSKIVQFEKDGEQYYTHAQWYEHIDEKGLKKLQKYKIGEILKETLANPIKPSGFYWKSMNPLFAPFE